MAQQSILTLKDVGQSGWDFAKTAGTYTCQRFQAFGEWAKDHKAQIAIALIITGIAIACFCAGGSAFAALALVKLHGLSHLLALNEFFSSWTICWYAFDAMMVASKLTYAVGAIIALFTKIFWAGAIGTGVGVAMLGTGVGLKLSAQNNQVAEQKLKEVL